MRWESPLAVWAESSEEVRLRSGRVEARSGVRYTTGEMAR
jgi:hypothetical protein